MREILFRGKDILTKEWIEGFYGNKLNVRTKRLDHYIMQSTYTASTDSSYFTDYQVLPHTVGQYTGLTDKNGTKIFEGDILKINSYSGEWVGVVRFNDKYCKFEIRLLDQKLKKTMAIHTHIRETEVIGNVHDKEDTQC